MDFRKIILTGGIGALVLAIGLLYVKVSRSASPAVDEAEIAKAESEYRSGAARSAARPPREPSKPPPKRSVTAVSKEPAADDEQPADPPPRALNMPATHLKRLSATEPEEEDSEATYEKRRLAANKLYDRRRFPESRDAALELLKERSNDRRMLRVVVSASCIMYEPDVAREYFQKLKEADKKAMRTRCARYEVDNLD